MVLLVDMPTLFALQDLELFESLFSVFPRVAIAQSILLEIQRNAVHRLFNLMRARFSGLAQILTAYIDQILQPASANSTDEDLTRDTMLGEDVKSLLSDKRFILYSDDAFFRIYATEDEQVTSSFCTLDLLRIIDELELLPVHTSSRVACFPSYATQHNHSENTSWHATNDIGIRSCRPLLSFVAAGANSSALFGHPASPAPENLKIWKSIEETLGNIASRVVERCNNIRSDSANPESTSIISDTATRPRRSSTGQGLAKSSQSPLTALSTWRRLTGQDENESASLSIRELVSIDHGPMIPRCKARLEFGAMGLRRHAVAG